MTFLDDKDDDDDNNDDVNGLALLTLRAGLSGSLKLLGSTISFSLFESDPCMDA